MRCRRRLFAPAELASLVPQGQLPRLFRPRANRICMKMRRFASLFDGRGPQIAAAFAIQITGVGFSFLFSIMLARLIGAVGVGIYFLAITIVDIGATISRLGLENTGL